MISFHKKKENIKLVSDSDLPLFLRSIGIYDSVVDGKVNCSKCGIKISIENVEAVFSNNGKIFIACGKPNCIRSIYERRIT